MACTPGNAQAACAKNASSGLPGGKGPDEVIGTSSLPADLRSLGTLLTRYPNRTGLVAALANGDAEIMRQVSSFATIKVMEKGTSAFAQWTYRQAQEEIIQKTQQAVILRMRLAGDGPVCADLRERSEDAIREFFLQPGSPGGANDLLEMVLDAWPEEIQRQLFATDGSVRVRPELDSREGVLWHLQRGLPVDPAVMVNYPDLVARFGL